MDIHAAWSAGHCDNPCWAHSVLPATENGLRPCLSFSSQLTFSKDDKPAHKHAAENPVCQQRYRLMEDLFPLILFNKAENQRE